MTEREETWATSETGRGPDGETLAPSSRSVSPVRYRTIVADPPWEQSDKRQRAGVSFHGGKATNTRLGYPTLSVERIAELPVASLSGEDAHLYLWTTTRLLRDAYKIAEAWGFTVGVVLVWAKPSRGFGLGDAFQSNVEFVLFGRRGSLRPLRRAESSWFEWKRGPHSAKPEAFLDLVESVSPGPYLELFARRQRIGWDTWGDEALNHVDLGRRKARPLDAIGSGP